MAGRAPGLLAMPRGEVRAAAAAVRRLMASLEGGGCGGGGDGGGIGAGFGGWDAAGESDSGAVRGGWAAGEADSGAAGAAAAGEAGSGAAQLDAVVERNPALLDVALLESALAALADSMPGADGAAVLRRNPTLLFIDTEIKEGFQDFDFEASRA